jgi:hypothetical protein
MLLPVKGSDLILGVGCFNLGLLVKRKPAFHPGVSLVAGISVASRVEHCCIFSHGYGFFLFMQNYGISRKKANQSAYSGHEKIAYINV